MSARRLLRGARRPFFAVLFAALATAIVLCLVLGLGLGGASGAQETVPEIRFGGAAKARFRSLCHLPVVRWSAQKQLWIPPMCRYLFLYAGVDPATFGAEPAFRALVTDQLGADGYHVWVVEKEQFGALTAVGGSDFVEQQWPSVLVLDNLTGSKYVLPLRDVPEERRAAAIDNFLGSLRRGRLAQFLKQEHIEDMPLTGGSAAETAPMDINAAFFERYIANNTGAGPLPEQERFVVFHAPWCGHCRVFLSKFEPLAKELLRRAPGAIGFYKLDVTANDLSQPRFRMRQVPTTLFFSRAGTRELTERNKVREGLLAFLRQHSRQLAASVYNEL